MGDSKELAGLTGAAVANQHCFADSLTWGQCTTRLSIAAWRGDSSEFVASFDDAKSAEDAVRLQKPNLPSTIHESMAEAGTATEVAIPYNGHSTCCGAP